ncbi:MAG TPA: ATP-dependent helicase [Thermoanaerobaculia bacterium]
MGRFVKPEDWQPAGGIRLEDAAQRVVTSSDSRSVIAGPGAGKTELLAQRALYLLQAGRCKPPQRILAVSFKRDAAKNLKDRVARRCSSEQAQRFDSYTFDAFAKSLVDRFLALAPPWCRPLRGYQIRFSTQDDWIVFLRGLTPPAALGGMAAAQALRRESTELWGPLPLEIGEPASMEEWVAVEWWRQSLSGPRAGVSFSMIGRLAQAILTYNTYVLRALRLTYSHVFLDEFQDTTGLQYDLTKLAFHGSPAVLTAVGDTKQRIMVWAGAETEVFSWFETDFRARREMLQMNHRSNRRIVQIINDLVTEIEPEAVETLCARSDDEVPEDATAFWIFNTDEDEANWLANFVADDIEANENRCPDDFALLVRVRADQAETQLRNAFAGRGLLLRNEARLVNGIAIQDLLSEELTSLFLNLIRVTLGVRGHDAYSAVKDTLGGLFGVDYDNPVDLKRLEKVMRDIVRYIREVMAEPPVDVDMKVLISALVNEIGEAPLRRTFRQYENDGYFRDVQTALARLIVEHAPEASDWRELVDRVEGKGQVRLMTVHKSKGLEYHTVIFVGLHQNAFWGYRNNQSEETNAFFVALSRARERVFFTWSRESGDTSQIRGLIELLAKAEVPFLEIS